jgi:hypothetical protein
MRALRGLRGALAEVAQAVVAEPVRRRRPDAAVTHDPQADHRVVDQRGLVDLRGGEARESRVLRVDDDLGLLRFGCGQRSLGGL